MAGNGDQNPFQSPRVFGLTLPHDDAVPAEFFERVLMPPVAGGVAVEFGQPPGTAVRGRGAVFAAAMPMPEAPVNEDGRPVFRQNNVGTAGKFSHMKPKAIAQLMKQRADGSLRRGVLAANAAHVPRAASSGEPVFVHGSILGENRAGERMFNACSATVPGLRLFLIL